jgi:hypothetical protein
MLGIVVAFLEAVGAQPPNCPARLGRTIWTWMSELSGQAGPGKMDIDVRIVRQGSAGKNGH